MATTTYSWEFPTLQTYTHKDGLENIVYTVHWYYKGERVVGTGSFSHQLFGAQQIEPYVSGSPFIPYDELTKEIVQNWVEASIGTGSIEAYRQRIDTMIDEQINPPVAYLPAPWNVTPTPTPSATPIPLPPMPTPTLTTP